MAKISGLLLVTCLTFSDAAAQTDAVAQIRPSPRRPIPADLHYTKDHVWIRVADGVATVGITDFAQKQLGDVVHVQLPRLGKKFKANDAFGEVESEKTLRELSIPISGMVIKINKALADAPKLINTSPYANGWMIKIKIGKPSEVDSLLSASEYEDYLESQKED
jgi:glycine cleavage system H protein